MGNKHIFRPLNVKLKSCITVVGKKPEKIHTFCLCLFVGSSNVKMVFGTKKSDVSSKNNKKGYPHNLFVHCSDTGLKEMIFTDL